ncbi:SPOR domain-containing protein [Corallococcus sp. M34]|uniref:SPOR domain-containing protein n=1 Tax=Citreicoccus inhibens TaxID=2849499 RepID=UPI001C215120|nr:SPOR domain-containing protein [Citreicoccus inhibens]MBU8897031.1 SPOR domain-containing protein [Citreicoccus inhibens]
MRDAHRMKEKFDVSLDNRQIVSLMIAGIVVMGAVFVLGVVVGKKLAGNAQAAAAPDLLSALDANAQALQEVQKEPPLTFQDELTRKSTSEPALPPAPKPAARASDKPAAKPVEKPTLAPTPDPDTGELPMSDEARVAEKPAAPKPVPVAAKPTEKPEPVAAKPTEKPEPVAAKPAPKPETVSGKVEDAAVPTRTASREGGGLKEAIDRVTQRPAEPPKPSEAVKGGAFSLQLSAFQNRPEADRFAARLRDRGYAPYIVPAEVPGKGTWYRVRMGSFASKEAAGRYLADFKRETQLDAFVAGTTN